MASRADSVLDTAMGIHNSAVNTYGKLDKATGKFQKRKQKGSIIKSAKKNIFEFPVFVSSSVPTDYAEATNSLLEQAYASYLQMAITAQGPIITAAEARNGLQFANLKTDTNKYLEYTDMEWAHDACHAVYQEANYSIEFAMLTLPQSDIRAINEYVDHQPLSEFDHFFQESTIDDSDDSFDFDAFYQEATDNDLLEAEIEHEKATTAAEKQRAAAQEAQKKQANAAASKELQIGAFNKEKARQIRQERRTNALVQKEIKNNGQGAGEWDLSPDGLSAAAFDKINQYLLDYINAENEGAKLHAREQLDKYFGTDAVFNRFAKSVGLTDDVIKDFHNSGVKINSSTISLLTDSMIQFARLEQLRQDIDPEVFKAHKKEIENHAKCVEAEARYAFMNAHAQATILQAQSKHAEDNERNKSVSLQARATIDFAKACHAIEDAQNESDILKAQLKKFNIENEGLKNRLDTEDKIREQTLRDLQWRNGKINRTIETTKDVTAIASTIANCATSVMTAVDKHKLAKEDLKRSQWQNKLLEKQVADYDEDKKLERESKKHSMKMREQEIRNQSKVEGPKFIDQSKLQKLNTMAPLTMSVDLRIMDDKDGISTPVQYIVGVKTHCRLIDADILPEVAEYPIKKMDEISRKAKWRAGELKFFKDIVFKIDEKKQAAADSKDPRRKWYKRLYTLAHMKGDAAAAHVAKGGSLIDAYFRDKIGKGNIARGVLPNVSMIITQSDVNNIKSQTNINLLKGSTARKFCDELFLMALVVIDDDAESVKLIFPDLHKDFEVHSIASIKKQIATLDTTGTKTKDMFKLLG